MSYLTPLEKEFIEACKGKNISRVRAALSAGVSVNLIWINNCSWKTTSLVHAASKGHLEVVRELLAAGADLNPIGAFSSPLEQASFFKHHHVVKVLLEAKAALNNGATVHETPLSRISGHSVRELESYMPPVVMTMATVIFPRDSHPDRFCRDEIRSLRGEFRGLFTKVPRGVSELTVLLREPSTQDIRLDAARIIEAAFARTYRFGRSATAMAGYQRIYAMLREDGIVQSHGARGAGFSAHGPGI